MSDTTVEAWLASRTVQADTAPASLTPLVRRLRSASASQLSRNDPAATRIAERQAAVLILLATDRAAGPDLLLQRRAGSLRDHAGEISFPGGSREPGDTGVVETALREATEETGLDPDGVDVLAILPRVHIPPSGFDVTGVVAHWRAPGPVEARDAGETASVMRISLDYLADPAHRLMLELDSGWRGPAFQLGDALVWGYTGEVISALLGLGGWQRPWRSSDDDAGT